MNGLTGMEKFSHLEDKIYLTIEFVKKLREEKESIVGKFDDLRAELAQAQDRNQQLETQLEVMLAERDAIQLKVEAMLEAMTVIDPEVARAIGR
jgi:FtsZ-binding cell division protein ZapB